MELTSHQLAALNTLLPAGYRLETVVRKDARPVGTMQRKTEADNLDFALEFPSRLPEKRLAREKKKSSAVDEAETKPRQGDAVRRILKVLEALKRSPYAEPFLQPVDLDTHHDYLQVVSEPMDLATVEAKLKNSDYETAYHFAMDVRKIWSNSFRYNAKGSELYSMTMEISGQFEKLMEGLEQLVLSDKKDALHDLQRKVERMTKEIKDLHSRGAPKVVIQKPVNDKPMTLQEKRMLGQSIRKLEPKHLRGVLDIVRDSMIIDADGGELVIDLDTLPPRVCRELENYVKNLYQGVSKHSKKKKDRDLTSTGVTSLPDDKSKRFKEVESKLEEIVQPKEQLPKEESESDSSSSDDSEQDEEMPAPTRSNAVDNSAGFSVTSMWSNFQQEHQMNSLSPQLSCLEPAPAKTPQTDIS